MPAPLKSSTGRQENPPSDLRTSLVAVTGRSVGLPLFESLEVLGRERTLARLRAAIDRL